MLKTGLTLTVWRKTQIPLYLILLCFANFVFASADNIRFEKVDMENGLSQETVRSIFQDSQGFMWFGTQEGLNKFDGVNFTAYSTSFNDPQSISSPWINDISEDDDGNLWVGTQDGINILRRDTDRFVRFTADGANRSINDKVIRDIVRTKDGNMWVATKRGLNKYNAEDNTFKPFNFLTSDGEYIDVYTMVEDITGELWLGTDSNGLYKFNTRT
jgi:ligand-binding sensor domain-containing protein